MAVVYIPDLLQTVVNTVRHDNNMCWDSTRILLLECLQEDSIERNQLLSIPRQCNIIIHSCVNGYAALLYVFISNGFNVNADIIGFPMYRFSKMVQFATIGGQLPLIQYLVSIGADLNCCNANGHHLLHCSVEWIKYFLYIKNVQLCFTENRYPAIDIMRYLHTAGCSVNATTFAGYTPLIMAVLVSNIDCITFLLNNEADVNVISIYGETALSCAFDCGKPCFAIVKLLLDAGADLNLRYNNNETILHLAVPNSSSSIVELLLEEGANPNSKDDNDNGPLYKYVFVQNPITDNVDGSFIDEDGINIVGILVIWYADVNIFDDKGRTLLHWAAWQGSIHLVKLLIERGLNVKDTFGKMPINYAADAGHHDIVDYFINHYADTRR